MAQQRLPERMITNILRMVFDQKLPVRQVAASCNVAIGTVSEYSKRAKAAGIGWPLPDGMDESELHNRLFPEKDSPVTPQRVMPNFDLIHQELKQKGVTKQLLWNEYRQEHADGYGYSQFCELYKNWQKHTSICMRQEHRAGEKMFVDYAGPKLTYFDPETKQFCEASIFVATLGASSYTYAEATATQNLYDWIGSNVRAYEFFGGVPELTVPDNLKTGVIRACRYEPEINQTYQDMARFYKTAIIPARPYKPRDKAKVEVAVQVAERWILAALRHRQLFGLAEVNQAIRELLARLNQRAMRHVKKSRHQLYIELDKPALKPLPSDRYEMAEFLLATVDSGHHVTFDDNFYSVDHSLVGKQVTLRITQNMVEILYNSKRVAAHQRCRTAKGTRVTIPEHRPKSHQKYLDWPPERIIAWGRKTGPNCADAIARILADKPHPEAGYRSCLGIIRMADIYGAPRMEAACHRALISNICSYQSIKFILKTKQDQAPLPRKVPEPETYSAIPAEIRGENYYK